MSVLLGIGGDERVASAMSNADMRGRLEQVNAELARSNRELEEFAYVASHDLKSPLIVVSGFLELLKRTKAEQLDEDAHGYVDAAMRGASRMQQLIEDLLTFSRVGRTDHASEWVDLNAIVAQLLMDWESAVRDAGGNVHVGPLPSVLGDATMLRQLFENLVSNSIKFRRPGVDLVIEITAERRRGEWLVRVSDNGIGIPAEHRESIFTMFSRLEQSTDRPGSGIGLAICHRVVQAHGGRLWVEDGTAGGAQMCFTLPADVQDLG
jgi:light-regulated signal transduction histidine kinase (bacteriophytochrome)